jgi:hypothetical protein
MTDRFGEQAPREKPRRNSPLLQTAPPATTTPSVFISYRRDDAAYAGRLFDRLGARFSEESIVIDLRLEPGADWVAAVESTVGAADIGLVLIGPQWARGSDVDGTRRLHDPGDMVRREIDVMLNSPRTLTVPVLVGGARMPMPQDLPEELRALSCLQALEVSDTRWDYDVARLIDVIESATASDAVPGLRFP